MPLERDTTTPPPTTTTVTLPPPPAQAARPAAILVVDDNPANRDALTRRLERRGYSVTAAEDGVTALHLLATRAFDLVLLDVMMPGMNGLEVLQRLRADRTPADLPVIMATAQGESEDVIKALGLGANDYVTKPLDFGVVLARVRTQLALKQSVEQIRDLERNLSSRNRELETANARLVAAAEQARRELKLAARVQVSLLPKTPPSVPGLTFAWAFKPCTELAGDSLNICPFDDGRVGLYVLDVAGHGVSAALLAVAATRLLSARDPDSIVVEHAAGDGAARTPSPPAVVATRLDQRFGWNPDTEQFLTIFYAVIDPATRTLAYTSAGHPGAIRVAAGAPASVLDVGGMPIGLGGPYETQVTTLPPGDRLYLYSDGLTEAMNHAGQQFGRPRLVEILESLGGVDLNRAVTEVMSALSAWCGAQPAQDDVSILAVEAVGSRID
jgi:sigma-B regulation protein RsbU (phosphoserine phosphatase)